MQPKDDDLHPQENWKTSIFESDLKLLFELIVYLLLFVVCFLCTSDSITLVV